MTQAPNDLHSLAEPEEGELDQSDEDGEILSTLDQRLKKNPLFNIFDPSRIPNNECATGMYP